jgi:hypothetical protein
MTDTVADTTPDTTPDTEVLPPAPAVERPAHVPEKFWDAKEGGIRTDLLMKSYLALERKMGLRGAETAPEPVEVAASGEETGADQAQPAADEAAPALPEGEPEARPVAPAGYTIAPPHPLIGPDPTLDARLQEAGFTQAQAQLVYDLAAERLLPMIQEALGEIEAQGQLERLQRQFGGPDAWRHTAHQLKRWAAAHLPPETYATLAASYEGVLALHQMMRASEPELLCGGEEPTAEIDEDTLAEMMRDPCYWRQRDPEFIARVTAGFKRLYAG